MDDFDQLIQLATAHYQSLRLGDAVDAYRAAIALRPGVAAVHNNLGSALRLLGRLDEAIAAFNEAIRLQPDAFQTWSNLGNLYKITGDLDRALAAFQRAIAINPDNAEAHNNLGATLEDTGDMPAAIACYRRAAELKPESAAIGSNLVYAMHFSADYSAEQIFAAHQAWNDRHAIPVALSAKAQADGRAGSLGQSLAPSRENANPRTTAPQRKLRIGYVSPDFRDHVIGRFMRPILANHDRSAVEIFCYSEVVSPDAMTHELRSHAEHWRVILGLPGEMAAERIRADGIDILVDLTMHMARNRLLLFARRPAAVQICYLAYCSTTGIDAMDYRLTDRWLDPLAKPLVKTETSQTSKTNPSLPPGESGSEGELQTAQRGDRPHLTSPARLPSAVRLGLEESSPKSGGRGTRGLPYSEQSVYLPETYWCYEAPAEAPDVSPAPANANGFVTFGCLNNLCKVSPGALEVWAEILARVPNSRLILHAKEGSHRERIRQRFLDLGVNLRSGVNDHDRLLFVPMLSLRSYFALYGQIDLSLDPFPYCGGTTTLDALWMGVPVITLAGETAVGRGGVSILSNLGLADLIARSKSAYVETAVRMAGDVPRLNQLRQSLRERMKSSSLTDAPRFTRNLERIFQQIAK